MARQPLQTPTDIMKLGWCYSQGVKVLATLEKVFIACHFPLTQSFVFQAVLDFPKSGKPILSKIRNLAMKNIAVIGSGTMGNGIAHFFAQQGYKCP